jgi:hypothetical protein
MMAACSRTHGAPCAELPTTSMTRGEVEAKALDLLRGPLAERARALVEACRRIEYSPDISEFARHWVPASGKEK